jgi:hypothetical protein
MLGKGLQPSEVKNCPAWKIIPAPEQTVLAGFCHYFGKKIEYLPAETMNR